MKRHPLHKILGILLLVTVVFSSFSPGFADASSYITATVYYDAIEAEYAKYHTHVNTIGYNKDDVFTLEELEEELKNIRESADLSNYDSELDAFVIETVQYNLEIPGSSPATSYNNIMRTMPIEIITGLSRTVSTSYGYGTCSVQLWATIKEDAQNGYIMSVKDLSSNKRNSIDATADWSGNQSGNYYTVSGTYVTCYYPGVFTEYKELQPGITQAFTTNLVLSFTAVGASGNCY